MNMIFPKPGIIVAGGALPESCELSRQASLLGALNQRR
jgi:hypothetical protein